MLPLKLNIDEINQFCHQYFSKKFTVTQLTEASCIMHSTIIPTDLRSGGTVSGPTMMGAVDFAIYLTIIAHLGIEYYPTVTSTLSFNFLRRPSGDKDLILHCHLLRIGRTLANGEVRVYSAHNETEITDKDLVAHAVGGYFIIKKED